MQVKIANISTRDFKVANQRPECVDAWPNRAYPSQTSWTATAIKHGGLLRRIANDLLVRLSNFLSFTSTAFYGTHRRKSRSVCDTRQPADILSNYSYRGGRKRDHREDTAEDGTPSKKQKGVINEAADTGSDTVGR